MPYSYSRKKALAVLLLEVVTYLFLCPLLLFYRLREGSSKRILLIEPFQMGDVLSLTPLIDPLLRKFPESEIYVATKISSGVILECDPRVKGVFKIDFPWSDYGYKRNSLKRLFGVLRNILKIWHYRFDIGIDTRGDIRSQILLAFAGCAWRVGHLNYMGSNLTILGLLLTHKLKRSKQTHRYLWNLELLNALGITEGELFPIRLPSFFPVTKVFADSVQDDSIVIHIGGGWEYKRWNELKWIQLINNLKDRGNQLIVIAGMGERDLIRRVEALVDSRQGQVFFKVTTLDEMIQYIKQCKLFIGLDSGPMNLAVCLNVRVLALFGPGDSTMWRPLSDGAKFIHKVEKYPCNPCLQTICVFPERSCMSEIGVEEILRLI